MINLFACDLDNTLIHSYKHKTADDICIEIYNGREQSFISSRTVELLKEVVTKVLLIPVTTRSIEQYQRIQWIEGIKPEYAVVSNGANLIYNDDIDLQWQSDSFKNYINTYSDELKQQQILLSQNLNFTICRIVDDGFLFLKCSDTVDIEKISTEIQKQTNLTVQYSGRKIYLFPPKLDKGEALLRLKYKFNPSQIFGTGDSVIDVPMLNLTDVAYILNDIPLFIRHNQYLICNSIEGTLEDIIKRSHKKKRQNLS